MRLKGKLTRYLYAQRGESPNLLRLSDTNEAEFRSGLAISMLPQMMQDAIQVAQGLSLMYVWIESLCI